MGLEKHEIMTEKQFKRLSRKERAILVAEDVIKQIKLGIYIPDNTYDTSIIEKDFNQIPENLDASTILKTNPNIKCEGCARASLFMSAVKFKNKLTVLEAAEMQFDNSPDKMDNGTRYLSEEFSKEQQSLIEMAYENDRSYNEYGFPDEVEDSCISFHSRAKEKWSKSSDKRMEFNSYLLIAICKNIIKNDGIFIP